ncbi:hypothetical protein HAV22_05230 [Massilia sp. TW-1]|uniref:Uncharacterized protein n=1 Tax=Telluria antibiotica TaxID=2717319 RepID=A0ABX0P886_9BURK|nr:hypothetical protein [Telluria antibiotica]NIA53057.1 hypothetical protein [Telluria antibiotica]
MKAIFKILIVWTMLLTLPLQGFAAATMSCCPSPSAAAQDCHDHDAMVDDGHGATAHAQADPHPVPHHHAAKCATCGTCGICIPMAPSFVGAPAVSASQSIAAPVDQHTLTSVDLAHPERPPRA